ncbi:MAG: aldo/keto reductase [Planctomycetota bacterium]
MKYGQVTGVAKDVSRLCQGTDMISDGNLEVGLPLLDAAFEQGINCFDCAHIYGPDGANEKTFAEWVHRRGVRDQVVLFDKVTHPITDDDIITPEWIAKEIDISLDRLKFDHIEILALHRDDPRTPAGEIVAVLNEYNAASKIGAFGGSNWSVQRLTEANDYAAANGLKPMTVSSPQYSLAEMINPIWPGCVGLGGASHAADRKWYAENDVAIFSWSSLGRGMLSGRVTRENAEMAEEFVEEDVMAAMYCEGNFRRLDRAWELAKEKDVSLPQIGLAFVLAQPMKTHPFTGGANAEQIAQNVSCLEIELTPEELAWLDLESDTR